MGIQRAAQRNTPVTYRPAGLDSRLRGNDVVFFARCANTSPMQFPELPHCRDCWYVAAPAAQVKRGGMEPVTLLGEQIILLRDNENTVTAMRDFCPHRGIPLRYGRFDGCKVTCCYHGWEFDMQGTCTNIPALIDGDKTDPAKIKAKTYPTREINGLIWVYMARGPAPETIPEPPAMPYDMPLAHVDSVTFPCDLDHAVIGLMDPSHGSFVHQSWWWRSSKSIHEKAKDFEPVDHGFRMKSHKPSSNSRAYKILGASGERKTEIAFRLPGLRTEHITIGSKHIVLLTALTPIDDTTTRLHQFMGTNIAALNLLKPLLVPFGKAFIQQDLDIVKKQQEGLRQPNHPPLMLLGDADAQAIWYYRLKKEYHTAQEEGRGFENPLKARTLRWRS